MEPNSTIIPPMAPIPPTAQPNFQQQPPKKKYKYLKGLLVCLLAEVLIGAGVAAYFWRDGQAIQQQSADAETINSLQQQITDLEQTMQQYDSASQSGGEEIVTY